MGTGYAGPGWEWPKGRDFDCTVGCFVTAGNKAIETITGGNLASRMRHNQHHVQRQQWCPPMGGPSKPHPEGADSLLRTEQNHPATPL